MMKVPMGWDYKMIPINKLTHHQIICVLENKLSYKQVDAIRTNGISIRKIKTEIQKHVLNKRRIK